MFNTVIVAAVVPLFLAIGCTSAAADVPAQIGEARVKRVDASDLDLRKPADRKVLDRRVGWAIMDVCPMPSGPSLSEMAQFSACRRKALSGTQPQVASLVGKAGGVGGQAVLARADIR